MINIKRWIVFVGRTALSGGGPLQAPHNGQEGRGGGRGVINYICQQTPTTATVVTLTTRYLTPGSRSIQSGDAVKPWLDTGKSQCSASSE